MANIYCGKCFTAVEPQEDGRCPKCGSRLEAVTGGQAGGITVLQHVQIVLVSLLKAVMYGLLPLLPIWFLPISRDVFGILAMVGVAASVYLWIVLSGGAVLRRMGVPVPMSLRVTHFFSCILLNVAWGAGLLLSSAIMQWLIRRHLSKQDEKKNVPNQPSATSEPAPNAGSEVASN